MNEDGSVDLTPPDGDEGRRELARDRTEWAMQRTLFARERTFSAWLRTALATVAAGLAVSRLIGHPGIPLLAPLVGTIFVAAGIGIFAIAFWRYRDGYRELREQGFRIPPLWAMGLLIAILILSSLAALALVFSSDSGP